MFYDFYISSEVADEETSFYIDGEQISFNFEIDLPEHQDDYPVIVEKKSKNGCICDKCGEIYPYADGPNQEDGTFKCFPCRKYG